MTVADDADVDVVGGISFDDFDAGIPSINPFETTPTQVAAFGILVVAECRCGKGF